MTLTKAEVNHLLGLLMNNEREGWYAGNKEQYWKRHKRITQKLRTMVGQVPAK